MKNNQKPLAILYDDNCPMCKAYTKAFVLGKLLEKENRISFTAVNMQQFKIDWQRAKHEIPVINLDTQEVKYGIDALTEILQQRFCWMGKLVKIKWIYFLLTKLYKLISYNRKIITASRKNFSGNFNCTPNDSLFWRFVLVVICSLIIYVLELASPTKNLFFHNFNTLYAASISILLIAVPLVHKKILLFNAAAQLSLTVLIASFFQLLLQLFEKNFQLQEPIVFVLQSGILLLILLQLRNRFLFTFRTSIL